MPITMQQMAQKLMGAQVGQEVFVSYLAGRKPTPRAIWESKKADEAYDKPIPKRWFQGRLASVRITKKGELVMTIFSTTRYNMDSPGAEGHFRSFNPSLGTMLSMDFL